MAEYPTRRTTLCAITAAGLSLALSACSPGGAVPPQPSKRLPRRFRMGFSPNPPRFTVQAVIEGINHWSQRAELAIIHEELPWEKLLAGHSPEDILKADKLELVRFLRGKGLGLFFMLDLTNGLGRESEARDLVKAGRSLTEPAVQDLAVRYALAVESLLQPQWLGLAAETNLIRAAAPPTLYRAVMETANTIESALKHAKARSNRFVSVQAETAWGRLAAREAWVGVEQDFADFPFTRALGISSYPYFGFDDPNGIPQDYFSRLLGGRKLPVIVTEGGWTSASLDRVKSTPAKQAQWVERQAQLLDSIDALAWLHLLYADLDIKSLPGPLPELLPLFAYIGLTDSRFRSKPALKAWDGQFARRLAVS